MWTLWVLIIGSFACKYTDAQGQRIAPGVPPQHYQQPVQQVHQVPPQIQQIPQQQFQQAPVQPQVPVQQVPAQQQHIPVQQQVPIQQAHGGIHEHGQQAHGGHHEHGQHPQQLLHNTNIAGEQDHMSEHLEVPIDTKKMTDQELQFYYFKMHDEDNNNKLDGCELSKSLIHWHEQGNKDPSVTNPVHKLFPDDELSALIDPILSMDDTNNDGYIDYPEFVQAQQNAAATGRP